MGALDVGLAASQEVTTVDVGEVFFCDRSSEGACETAISEGDTSSGTTRKGVAGHTVTFCGSPCDDPLDSPIFDSGKLLAGETFAFTFDEPGEYAYYCEFHPIAMRASILVQAQQTPAAVGPTLTAEASPTLPAGDARTADGTSPTDHARVATSDGGDSQIWVIVPIATVATLAVLGGLVFAFRRSRE